MKNKTAILLISAAFILLCWGRWNIEDTWWTYDPTPPAEPDQEFWYGWKSCRASFTDGWPPPASHVVKDGVAAYLNTWPNGSQEVRGQLYDVSQHDWPRYDASATNPTALQISHATVTWTDDSGARKQGYDYTDQTWKAGQDTKGMANFVFAPLEPRPGQFVYLTDMSIAANAWIYLTGDGFTTGDRSFFHKYANAGQYTAKQDVLGTAGFDTLSQTVPVKAPANPGLSLLLLN